MLITPTPGLLHILDPPPPPPAPEPAPVPEGGEGQVPPGETDPAAAPADPAAAGVAGEQRMPLVEGMEATLSPTKVSRLQQAGSPLPTHSHTVAF